MIHISLTRHCSNFLVSYQYNRKHVFLVLMVSSLAGCLGSAHVTTLKILACQYFPAAGARTFNCLCSRHDGFQVAPDALLHTTKRVSVQLFGDSSLGVRRN